MHNIARLELPIIHSRVKSNNVNDCNPDLFMNKKGMHGNYPKALRVQNDRQR